MPMPMPMRKPGPKPKPTPTYRKPHGVNGTSARDALAVSPRTLGRLIAADFALPALSGMAIDCGYYDHAQMTPDFRRYAGMARVQLAAAARAMPRTPMAMYRYEHADKQILPNA